MKRAIVNLSTKGYWPGQVRLFDSFPNEIVLLYRTEKEVGAPPHHNNPYAFKIYAIEKARELGYTQILWLDASVYSIADPAPVWDWLTEKGIFLEEAGHYAGSWCNDAALSYFGITRDEAMTMPMFAAGYCGFDFNNSISVNFFAEWKRAMQNGIFKGSWSDHRHDMTCGSIIANQMGLPMSKGGNFFAYVGEIFGTPKESVVFHLKGL